jgi:hypothetical protein
MSIIDRAGEAWKRASAFVSSKTGKFVIFAAFTLLVAIWSRHLGIQHSHVEIASLQHQLIVAKDEARTNLRAYDSERLKAEKAVAAQAALQKKVDKHVSDLGRRKGIFCGLFPTESPATHRPR